MTASTSRSRIASVISSRSTRISCSPTVLQCISAKSSSISGCVPKGEPAVAFRVPLALDVSRWLRARLLEDEGHRLDAHDRIAQLLASCARQTRGLDRGGEGHALLGIDELLLERGAQHNR